MARFKTRRQARYSALRRGHLLHYEAVELSKLPLRATDVDGKTRPNPIIGKIIQIRSYMWSAIQVEARAKGWSTDKKNREWQQRVYSLYSLPSIKVRKNRETGMTEAKFTSLLVKKDVHGRPFHVPTISPWDYYHSMQIEWVLQEWDSPRRHRRAQPDVDLNKIMKMRWIHDLDRKIMSTIDPHDKAQYIRQRQNLRQSTTMRRATA